MRPSTDAATVAHERPAEGWSVRPVRADDLAAVAAIYSEGIQDRVATFETEPRTAADVAPWLDLPYPFLVASRGDAILGWIHASPYRPRACYAGIGDFSVYVARHARGYGVGDALLTAFLRACAAASLWKVVARIFVENAASRALCARHGFREVGIYEQHGQLDGLWRDVVIVERLLIPLTPARS